MRFSIARWYATSAWSSMAPRASCPRCMRAWAIRVFIHGAVSNKMIRTAAEGVEICLTATLIDGLVMARSAFHHSVNYRSVVIFGRATEVTDPERKLAAMRALVEHIGPGTLGRFAPAVS